MGVVFAFLNIPQGVANWLKTVSLEEKLQHQLGTGGYYFLGILFFAVMGWMLYRAGMKKTILESS
jgi:TRAP-type mannitol/chloroaromatic compound transport system permease large subunit